MYNLNHRDVLLGSLAAGLGNIMRKRGVNLDCVEVKVVTPEGQLFAFGLREALDMLANDLYFDERGNWSDAAKLTVETI